MYTSTAQRRGIARTLPTVIAVSLIASAGCGAATSRSTPATAAPASGAAAAARLAADRAAHTLATYDSTPGPAVVVLEGDMKSANASFTQKVTPNNIADFAELELTRANFDVLDRSAIDHLTREFRIAYGLGDPDMARRLLEKGRFKATRWVLRFDVLKAEPVAATSRGFSAAPLGAIAGSLVGGLAGDVTRIATRSTAAEETAAVWLVGLRYTIIDATTTEQRATGYVEEQMEIGTRARSMLGFSQSEAGGQTLDSLAQRLVQVAVAEIDANYK